jgi:hypothetical protein
MNDKDTTLVATSAATVNAIWIATQDVTEAATWDATQEFANE